MKRIMCISVLIFLANPVLSFGQEGKGIDTNLENMSGQYAECAAYYRLVYHAMNSSNEKETAKGYRQLEDEAMFYSLLLANKGRSKDVAIEVTNSRIEMYIKKMKQEANSRNENISILINKYHFSCQQVMENPSIQLLELLRTKVNEVANQPESKQ
jgi:hypothetical protein